MIKTSTGFSRMFVTASFWVLFCKITCKWVLFPGTNVYFYWLALLIKIDNRPVTTRRAKTATIVRCVFYFEKASLASCLLPFLFVCVHRDQQGNLAFRMTTVEDTHLTLADMPF